jgi:hypothetical protein
MVEYFNEVQAESCPSKPGSYRLRLLSLSLYQLFRLFSTINQKNLPLGIEKTAFGRGRPAYRQRFRFVMSGMTKPQGEISIADGSSATSSHNYL